MPNFQPYTPSIFAYPKANLFPFHIFIACNNTFNISRGVLNGAANYMVIILPSFGGFVKKINFGEILISDRPLIFKEGLVIRKTLLPFVYYAPIVGATGYSIVWFSKYGELNLGMVITVLIAVVDDNENEPDLKKPNRVRPPKWSVRIPMRARSMLLTGDRLFLAGSPDRIPKNNPSAAFEGRLKSKLWCVSTEDGRRLSEIELDGTPIFDEMSAGAGILYIVTEEGSVVCLRKGS